MWLYPAASASTCAAMFSASASANCAPSACSTLPTPAICAAASAAAPALLPATSTWTSPPQASAAVTVLSVAPLMVALSCSATTNAVMSDHLRFVLELVDQCRHVGHL